MVVNLNTVTKVVIEDTNGKKKIISLRGAGYERTRLGEEILTLKSN